MLHKSPLAELLRPKNLDDVVGQQKLVSKNGLVRQMLDQKQIPSLILWGPPGCGKTTLAKIIGQDFGENYFTLSAVNEGKDKLKQILKQLDSDPKKAILFIDEIHRWNKAQQDALLPFVENGKIILIGATTQNPSFSIVSALLSRTKVLVLDKIADRDIENFLYKALTFLFKENSKDLKNIEVQKTPEIQETLSYLAKMSDGDLRFAINALEIIWNLQGNKNQDKVLSQINLENLKIATQKSLLYDKNGQEHYDIISAVHKSLRSSNPTAGVYWVMRMLLAGEDPLYVARRLLRFASEDIGNINPNALLLANQVFETVKNLGMPECEITLVQLAEYLAKSPKNNSAYVAAKLAKKDIQKHGSLPVPLHLRNASTKLNKDLGYGKNYEYDHDLKTKKSQQECLPKELKDVNYFEKN